MRRPAAVAAALVLLGAPAAARANHRACFEPPPRVLAAGDLQLTLLHAGAGELTQVTTAPGDGDHLYVTQRDGRVWRMRTADGSFDPRPFLDLRDSVSSATGLDEDERGMQSIAFAPDYARSRRVYAFYSDRRGDTRVREFPTRRTILRVPHSFSHEHFGGQLAFGPDRRLYVSLGDAQRWRWAQRRRLYGQIVSLRPAHPERSLRVLAKGLRNPFRFSFAPGGEIVIGDVGETLFEEIDVLRPRSAGAVNFGWPYFEGRRRRFKGRLHHYVPPVLAYGHANGTAVVGGATSAGRYLYGDLCNGWIASASLSRRPAQSARTGLVLPFLTSFGTDAGGRVYITAQDGSVYRLDASAPSGPPGM